MSANRGVQSRQFKASARNLAGYIGGVKATDHPFLLTQPARRPLWPLLVWLAALAFALVFALATPRLAQAQAQAQAVPGFINQVIPQAVALARQAALVTAPQQARIQIEPGALDPRLNLAPCVRVEAFMWPGVSPWGRTRVGLRCAEGQVRWRVSLPMTVQVWAPGVVMRADLPAGAKLAAEHLGRAQIDWADGLGTAVERIDLALGRQLARPLVAGQGLRSTDLQARQWFARGETVRVQVNGSGFAIVANGEALNPGLEGQLVRVRMAPGGAAELGQEPAAGGGRVITGTAVGERRVEVQL
jgi:flagellar basal body P-ring formation protein FlgA